jgi:hypothetical protein
LRNCNTHPQSPLSLFICPVEVEGFDVGMGAVGAFLSLPDLPDTRGCHPVVFDVAEPVRGSALFPFFV